MNIIELFEKLTIDKDKTIGLSNDEIIRIEKQINVERKINPEVEATVASNLIDALKNYSLEFQFIASHRVFYNFFAKTTYSRDHFLTESTVVENDKIQAFISRFLEDELRLFFDKKFIENRFDDMNNLLEFHRFLPDDFMYHLAVKTNDKILLTLDTLTRKFDFETVRYCKQRSFFDFLSFFSSLEMDRKVQSLLQVAAEIYKTNNNSEFAISCMLSMEYYDAFIPEFKEILVRNGGNIRANQLQAPTIVESSGFSFRVVLAILFPIIALFGSLRNCGSSSSTSSPYPSNEIYINDGNTTINSEQVIRNYTNELRIAKFVNYLTDFDSIDTKSIQEMRFATGENPFQANYFFGTNFSKSEGGVRFTNTTSYDIIILENSMPSSTVELPNHAYYLRSKDHINIDVKENFNKNYAFYFGKNLASFYAKNDAYVKRRDSISEYRFLKQPIVGKDIIKHNFRFENDVEIVEKNNKFSILSAHLYEQGPNSSMENVNQFDFK